MDDTAHYVSKTMKKNKDCYFIRDHVWTSDKQLVDAELAEMADYLLAHPNVATRVFLGRNRLTDETGVKLARYLAASSTIEYLDLSYNQLGSETYLAVAAALRVNSSLRWLDLYGNQAVDQTRIDAAFVEALRLNPHHSVKSMWQLYSRDVADIDFERLQGEADALGHPTLQMILNHELEKKEIKSTQLNKHIL